MELSTNTLSTSTGLLSEQVSPLWYVFPSTLIAGWGAIFNLFSLSYFARRKRESLGNKLLILLNALNLFVCVIGTTMLGMMVVYWKIPRWIHETVQMLYFVFLETTGFATCLLSAARCISLYAPFYRVKGHYIAFAATSVISYTLLREMVLARAVDRRTYYVTGLSLVHMGILQSEIGLMIVVVLMLNMSSMMMLLMKSKRAAQSRKNSVHATITVAILSFFYCVLHSCYLITGILYFFYGYNLNKGSWFLYFGIFYAAPLNSAINPFIYLLRKKDMNRYLKHFAKTTVDSLANSIQKKVTHQGKETADNIVNKKEVTRV